MDNHLSERRQEILSNGFTVINEIYTHAEVKSILEVIASANQNNPAFRKTDDVFAIRQFLKEVPQIVPLIFNDKLKAIINTLFDAGYFVSKSMYFDKPELSNWFVAWHQDLIIVVDEKADVEGYGSWTAKQNQFGVQPPLSILQDNLTIRIHLDDTNEENGALKVIPGSHLKDVYRSETIDWSTEIETTCNVNLGCLMIMRPLLLHSSNRTTNNKKRRVVHIEFSRAELDGGLEWGEKLVV